MTWRVQTLAIAGVLSLAALAPAHAQRVPMRVGPTVRDYTGVITPYGYIPPTLPSTWMSPFYVLHYDVPQTVYVPVVVAPERPAVQPIATAMVTLREGAAPEDVRVKAGTVVTWMNDADQVRSLIVEMPGTTRDGTSTALSGGRLSPNGRFSMAFYQTGIYEYRLANDPERPARVIVEP